MTERAGERAAAVVRTVEECTIVQFDTVNNVATVQPVVRETAVIDGVEVYAPEVQIPNVPVRWPGDGSGVSITWPLPVGAEVLLLVRDRSYDEVDGGGALPSTPASRRRWDLADAVVLPFGWSSRDPLPSNAYSGTQIVMRLPTARALLVGANTAARTLALATETAARLAAIEGVINGLTLPVSGATAGPPVPPPFLAPTTAADIQSTRVKVDA